MGDSTSPKAGEAAKDLKVENLDFAGRTMGAAAAASGHADSALPDSSSGGLQFLSSAQRGSTLTNPQMEVSKSPISGRETEDDEEDLDWNEEEQSGHEVHDAYKLFKHLQRTARDHGSRVPFLAELEMRRRFSAVRPATSPFPRNTTAGVER